MLTAQPTDRARRVEVASEAADGEENTMASINPGPPRQPRTPSGTGTTRKRKKVSTHWLYVVVIFAAAH
ncbi:MAG TPA: hypothetical protein VES60_15515 [Nakamurella sp.]|nr:hypothetical protein [Nakamurella sp.]